MLLKLDTDSIGIELYQVFKSCMFKMDKGVASALPNKYKTTLRKSPFIERTAEGSYLLKFKITLEEADNPQTVEQKLINAWINGNRSTEEVNNYFKDQGWELPTTTTLSMLRRYYGVSPDTTDRQP